MEESNSNNDMKIDELKEEIENLREEKEQALLLLEQKQSEVDCAVSISIYTSILKLKKIDIKL